ncbi:MAG: FlgD immunoglobulin-like domain containing protein [Bacteroidota bacterium]
MDNHTGLKKATNHRRIGIYLFYAILLISSCQACIANDKNRFNFSKYGQARPSNITVSWTKQILQGYNFRIWMANDLVMGEKAFDSANPPPVCGSTGIGCEYPVGSCIEHLFGAGPWIGGLINGTRYVTESYNGDAEDSETLPQESDTLRDRFWVTSISDSLYDPNRPGYYKYAMNRRGYDDDGDGKIDEDELDGLDNDHDWVRATDDIGADGIPDTLEVGCKGVYNPITNPDPAYDNYDPLSYDSCHPNPNGTYPLKNNKDKYTEKNGIPDHGEPHVDEDYGAVSDHDVYVSSTDTAASGNPARHRKMGIKIFQKSYAWKEKFGDAILPMDYYFINVGQNIITNVFVAFFCDMNVGPVNVSDYYNHNYPAYYPDIHTGYIVNAIDHGSTPLGLTILQTPRRLDSLIFNWQWFDVTTAPGPGTDDSILYAWMSGEKGYIRSQFTSTSDSRFLLPVGPFATMYPGDTLKISVAYVSGDCIDQCPNSMRANAFKAMQVYRRGYTNPGGLIPPSPRLKLSEGFNNVVAQWGTHLGGINPQQVWDDSNKLVESFPDTSWRRIHPPLGHIKGGRIFEGYRLYKSDDPAGALNSFKLLREYDVKGDTFGANTGLDSVFSDSNIVYGKTYWYAVTSFKIPEITYVFWPDTTSPTGVDSAKIYTGYEESDISENRTRITITNINDKSNIPQNYVLYPSYPNPFNPTTTISYGLPKTTDVTIKIYDILGKDIRTLVNSTQQGGSYHVIWNGTNDNGVAVASGIYTCRLIANNGLGSFTQTTKLILLK